MMNDTTQVKKRKRTRATKKDTPVVESSVDTVEPETQSQPEKEQDPVSDALQSLNYNFKSLTGVSEKTLQGVNAMGFEKMMEVQARTIPHSLSGRDVVAAAKTGSGKTVAFLIPTIELLCKAQFNSRSGVGAVIITPTRELALQIYGEMSKLLAFHSQSFGIVIGGEDRKKEAKKLAQGINILVATPGRLLDHLRSTKFTFKNLQMLIIDEADRILEIGFEKELREIINILPKDRQTMLFSATQTQKVADISRVVTAGTASKPRPKPLYIGVDDGQEFATRDSLEQGYVICDSDARFLLLYTFLKKNRKRKVIVFFSTCAAVTFYSELLNYVDIPVLSLHGKLKQGKRTSTFFEFAEAESGALLCTDVAARGLDIPAVDWILQFDPAGDPKEYIHRVGRTARGVGNVKGRAIVFLLPQEVGYLKCLRDAKVPCKEFDFPANKIAKVQTQLENLIEKNYYLYKSAREAYRSYVQAYSQAALSDVFDVHSLDLSKVSKSFGFGVPPKVNFNISLGGKQSRKRKQAFSEDSPYGPPSGSSPSSSSETSGNRISATKQWSR